MNKNDKPASTGEPTITKDDQVTLRVTPTFDKSNQPASSVDPTNETGNQPAFGVEPIKNKSNQPALSGGPTTNTNHQPALIVEPTTNRNNQSASSVDPTAQTHRLALKAKLGWWTSFFKGQCGARVWFLLSLPCGFALMMYLAGPKAWGLGIPTAVVWLSFVWLSIDEVKRQLRHVTEATTSPEFLTLRSPAMERKISWVSIKDFMPATIMSVRPGSKSERVVILNNNDEFFLPKELSGSDQLFAAIEAKREKPVRAYDFRERLDDQIISGGTAAVAAIIIALLFGQLKPFFMQLSAPELAGPLVHTSQYLINVAASSAICVVIVALWLKLRSRYVTGIFGDKNGLVLQTIDSKLDLPANKISAVNKLGRNLLFRTAHGWFLLVAADNLECCDKLLALLQTWKFDLVKRFANLRSDAGYVKAQKRARTIMAAIFLVAVAGGIYSFMNFDKQSNEWQKSGLDKVGHVVVADRDIPAGKSLDALDLRELKGDSSNAFVNSVVFADLLVGKRVKEPIMRGLPLTTYLLGDEDGAAITAAELKRVHSNDTSGAVKRQRAANAGKNIVVYTIADIAEGAKVTKEAIAERTLDEDKIPAGAISSLRDAVGKVAKYGVSANQIIDERDLAVLMPVMCATKDITRGKPIERSEVKQELRVGEVSTTPADVIGKIPQSNFKAGSLIHFALLNPSGKILLAKHQIKAGSLLSTTDVKPSKMDPSQCPTDSVENTQLFSGHVAAHDIAAGQLIRSSDLAQTALSKLR